MFDVIAFDADDTLWHNENMAFKKMFVWSYGLQSVFFARHKFDSKRFVMIGNSLKSDILPVLAIG